MVQIRGSDLLNDCVSNTLIRKDVNGTSFVTRCSVLNRDNLQIVTSVPNVTHNLQTGEAQRIENAFTNKEWTEPSLNITIDGEKVVFVRELDDQTEIHAKILSESRKSIGLACSQKFVALVESSDSTQGVNTFLACSILISALKTLETDYPDVDFLR